MREFPIIENKRFWPFRLNELVDLFSHQVNVYSLKLPDDPKAVADAVIRDIEYPFHLGQPDDTHIWNCYHGSYKFCKRVDLDFWDKASEVAFIKVADCDGSSMLFTALAGKLVGADGVYEIFGVVKDANTGEILGGHAWSVCKWGGQWHLVESTLDVPPVEYPVIIHYKAPYKLGEIVYEPMNLFNWKHYLEISPIGRYLALGFKAKASRKKYEAIQKAWHMPVKPLTKITVLSKLKWRH